MRTLPIIYHATLAERVSAGAVRSARIIGRPGGWGVLVRLGRTAHALAARRGGERVFRRFETLVDYLRELGLDHYDVDARSYAPQPARRRRPDTAARMQRAHAAAEHDRWFREQVEATLGGIEGGSVGLVLEADHAARWDRKRAELLSRTRARSR